MPFPHADRLVDDGGRVVVPLIKAEVQASVRIVNGLRATVSAGLNAPSVFAVRFGVMHVFGR